MGIPHGEYITHIHLLLSFQYREPRNMKFFLLCVVSLVGVSLAMDVEDVAASVDEIEDQLKDMSFTVEGLETSLKALDDSVKDEFKDLKQLVEDEFDDLKYILNIVLANWTRCCTNPNSDTVPVRSTATNTAATDVGGTDTNTAATDVVVTDTNTDPRRSTDTVMDTGTERSG